MSDWLSMSGKADSPLVCTVYMPTTRTRKLPPNPKPDPQLPWHPHPHHHQQNSLHGNRRTTMGRRLHMCLVFARAPQPLLLVCTRYAERSRLHPRPPLHAPFYLRLTSATSLPTQTREMGGLQAEGHAYAHPIWQAWQSVWGGETQGGREVATTTTHKLHLVAQR